MEAKVTMLDPTGSIVEEKTFDIPFIPDTPGIKWCKCCGQACLGQEPMRQNRYTLELNGYIYLVNKNGFIERINHDEDGIMQ